MIQQLLMCPVLWAGRQAKLLAQQFFEGWGYLGIMPVRIQLQTPELQMMDVLPYAELLAFVHTQIVGSYTC